MSPPAPIETTAPMTPSPARRRAKKETFPAPPKFKAKEEERQHLKGRLALAFRIFAGLGFDEGTAGHITVRDPIRPDCFWVNPFGIPWPYIKASDLILVDESGTVVDGGANHLLNTSAYFIHAAVHSARPDVNCVAHSHSIYGRSFSAFGRAIDSISQDACVFHDDLAVYNSFKGVVLDEDEGKGIAAALGKKKAALLQHHGMLTVGQTVESAVFWFISLEKCCHSQLLVDAAAAGRGASYDRIDDEDAEKTKQTMGSERMGWWSGQPRFEIIARQSGEDYLR